MNLPLVFLEASSNVASYEYSYSYLILHLLGFHSRKIVPVHVSTYNFLGVIIFRAFLHLRDFICGVFSALKKILCSLNEGFI